MPAAVELPPSAGQNHGVAVLTARPHGHFLAGEAGELAGVSGNTIGQWARWGYIRASQSAGDPHVYSVEDVTEAAIVSDLLARGIRPAAAEGHPAAAQAQLISGPRPAPTAARRRTRRGSRRARG